MPYTLFTKDFDGRVLREESFILPESFLDYLVREISRNVNDKHPEEINAFKKFSNLIKKEKETLISRKPIVWDLKAWARTNKELFRNKAWKYPLQNRKHFVNMITRDLVFALIGEIAKRWG